MLTGCPIVLSKVPTGETVTEETVLAEQVVGQPVVTVIAHADGLGWTVAVQEPIERTVGRRRRQHWVGEAAEVAPVRSHLLAALICPAGLIVTPALWFWDAKSLELWAKFSKDCLYMLGGIVPSGHLVRGAEEVVEPNRQERGWKPVTEAEVGLRVRGGDWMRYVVEADGRKSLRLDRLPLPAGSVPLPARSGAGQAGEATEVQVGVWRLGVQIADRRERVSAEAWERLMRQPVIVADRWPRNLVVGLMPWQGLPEPEQVRWERRLQQALVEVVTSRQGRVVSLTPAMREAIERERVRQYAGAVADDRQVAVGREWGATVLVRPTAQRGYEPSPQPERGPRPQRGSGPGSQRGDGESGLWQMGVDVLLVETGEVLDSVSWEVPGLAREGALEALIGRVQRVLEQAPVQSQPAGPVPPQRTGPVLSRPTR